MAFTTNSPRQRSLPSGCIGASLQAFSPSRRKRTRHASTSCPSAKQSASTITRSPTIRFTAKRPSSTCGETFSTTARARPSAGSEALLREAVLRAGNSDSSVLEVNRGKRRQRQRKRLRATVQAVRLRVHAAEIADPASTVSARIAVQHFAPEAGLRNADLVVAAGHGREIARDEQRRSATRAAHEDDDARVAI